MYGRFLSNFYLVFQFQNSNKMNAESKSCNGLNGDSQSNGGNHQVNGLNQGSNGVKQNGHNLSEYSTNGAKSESNIDTANQVLVQLIPFFR